MVTTAGGTHLQQGDYGGKTTTKSEILVDDLYRTMVIDDRPFDDLGSIYVSFHFNNPIF